MLTDWLIFLDFLEENNQNTTFLRLITPIIFGIIEIHYCNYTKGDGYGYGYGSGNGYGYGYGNSSGSGYGYGDGNGYGSSYGSGNGYGNGSSNSRDEEH